MKDSQLEIRKAYASSLSSIGVPVSDSSMPDSSDDGSYVILSTQTDSIVPNKHCAESDCTILLDVVTKTTNATGRKANDLLANAILQAIGNGSGLTVDGFQLTTTQKISNDSLYNKSGSKHIYRRLIRYRHLVVEI